jgi:pimeloyl-ACP methyl ester carboxylesterase
MSTIFAAILGIGLAMVTPSNSMPIAPGLYRDAAGHSVYVGIEHELPDAAENDFFDSRTHRTGEDSPGRLSLIAGVHEERRIVNAPEGRLGVSLWYGGSGARPVIILIHGNDPETRDMGFLIPYFVTNGINVLTYDQRGTGQSSGDWSTNGPLQRADDVDAIFDAYETRAHIEAGRIGVLGFSNGGWTAPIVVTRRHFAFMILKSAPAESLETNIMYEVTQRMHRRGFGDASTDAALKTWRTLIDFIDGRTSSAAAENAYKEASSQAWFEAAFIPPHLRFPLSPPVAAGLRRAVNYDPLPVLKHVKTPTLALFGGLDRNVDVRDASTVFPAVFKRSGMTDFTLHVYPHVGHSLEISQSGFNGDFEPPERFTPEYPQVMIDWLRQRQFLH